MEITKDKVQQAAFDAWVKADRRGTIEAITGIGKNKISLMAALELPKEAEILFLAETTLRERDLKAEIKKWKYKGAPIQFMCYQSAYKLKGKSFDLVIADEIHDSLTREYSAFYFNNTYKSIMGLSATIDREANVNEDGSLKKGELLDKIVPVCFKYSIDDGQRDGTSRKLNIYKIWHELDKVKVNVTINQTKTKPGIVTTEYAGYKQLDAAFKRAMFAPINVRSFIIRGVSAKRAELLYKLPSKIEAVKKLCAAIDTKTILFGNSLDALLEITPNVVSSKNSATKNNKILSAFEKGRIKLIASFKQLKQGTNLSGLRNCINMSYYSKEKDIVQRFGRLRKDGESEGDVFIFVTRDTQEIVWFSKMLENVTSFEIKEFNGVEECINYLKTKNNA